jgi:hypothetical protein
VPTQLAYSNPRQQYAYMEEREGRKEKSWSLLSALILLKQRDVHGLLVLSPFFSVSSLSCFPSLSKGKAGTRGGRRLAARLTVANSSGADPARMGRTRTRLWQVSAARLGRIRRNWGRVRRSTRRGGDGLQPAAEAWARRGQTWVPGGRGVRLGVPRLGTDRQQGTWELEVEDGTTVEEERIRKEYVYLQLGWFDPLWSLKQFEGANHTNETKTKICVIESLWSQIIQI